MRGVDDRAAALLRLLFRAPGDPAGWRAFYEALGREISPDVRVVTLVERTHPAASTTLFGVDMLRVADGLLPRRSDGKPRIEALPVGAVFELPRLGSRITRHPVVEKLLGAEGLRAGPALGVVLAQGGDVRSILLVLPSRDGWMPSADDRALFASVGPFVPLAAQLHERFAGASALTSLLDHLVMGVILLDDHREVRYANRSAAELLGVEPGLTDLAEGDRRDPRSEALYRTVQSADREDDGAHHHPEDGRPLRLLESRLDWPTEFSMAARHFRTALFIGDPKHQTGDPFQNLGLLYGLTPAESRLAWLLVGDRSLAEAADQLGITQNTARTVLKRILAKTGTKRQASLVRLLLSGPAQLRGAARATPKRVRAPKPRR